MHLAVHDDVEVYSRRTQENGSPRNWVRQRCSGQRSTTTEDSGLSGCAAERSHPLHSPCPRRRWSLITRVVKKKNDCVDTGGDETAPGWRSTTAGYRAALQQHAALTCCATTAVPSRHRARASRSGRNKNAAGEGVLALCTQQHAVERRVRLTMARRANLVDFDRLGLRGPAASPLWLRCRLAHGPHQNAAKRRRWLRVVDRARLARHCSSERWGPDGTPHHHAAARQGWPALVHHGGLAGLDHHGVGGLVLVRTQQLTHGSVRRAEGPETLAVSRRAAAAHRPNAVTRHAAVLQLWRARLGALARGQQAPALRRRQMQPRNQGHVQGSGAEVAVHGTAEPQREVGA